MNYPAKTTDGETVTIVDKRVMDASRAIQSTVLVAADGRTFAPARQGGLIEEILVMDDEADGEPAEDPETADDPAEDTEPSEEDAPAA